MPVPRGRTRLRTRPPLRDRRRGGSSGNVPEIAPATPMMRQYLETKARVPDAILFFRLGDFYEMT